MRIRSFVALCVFVAIAAAPSASGATGFTWTESAVTVAGGDQFDPSISGPYITYTDTSAGSADVLYYDVTVGTTHPVAFGPGDQQLSDVNGNLVAYTGSNGGPADVFLYDITTGTTQQLTSSPSDQINPAISSRLVVYEDYSSGAADICTYSLLESTTACLSKPGDQVSPAVAGASVVYIDVASGSSIVLWDTTSGATQTLDAGPASSPDIDGAHVVYAVSASGGNDVATYDLASGTGKVLSLPGDQVNPHISGDWISFEDQVTGVSHLGLWNYVTGEVEHPNVSANSQSLNDISGHRVVYTDNRNGNLDVFMLEFVPPVSADGQIGGLIGDVQALGLPKGTQTSLLAKLDDAQAALKVGNTAAACSDLASFISETNAQSGKKIAASDASALIAKAQQIEASIPC